MKLRIFTQGNYNGKERCCLKKSTNEMRELCFLTAMFVTKLIWKNDLEYYFCVLSTNGNEIIRRMEEKYDGSPLCCCQYVDRDGEVNHILACCCNCAELDLCCDRLITCRPVSQKLLKSVMGACLDRLRCPGRGGAFSPFNLSYAAFAPFVIQPVMAMSCVLYVPNIVLFVGVLVIAQALVASYMAKHNARSQVLYYWTIAAVTYTIIMFESTVLPLLEIRWDENLIVVIMTFFTFGCFYLTKWQASHFSGNRPNGSLMGNGVTAEGVCPSCRNKIYPRSVHCLVCHACVPRYDHHCFWLDCCIGENNQLCFFLGLIFGFFSLVYGSLLILTTVCRPAFKYGLLVPTDCSDASLDLELGLCYLSAVYCLGLAVLLVVQFLHHAWLISWAISGEEWRLMNYSLCAPNPYSRGCFRNWIHFFKLLQKLRH